MSNNSTEPPPLTVVRPSSPAVDPQPSDPLPPSPSESNPPPSPSVSQPPPDPSNSQQPNPPSQSEPPGNSSPPPNNPSNPPSNPSGPGPSNPNGQPSVTPPPAGPSNSGRPPPQQTPGPSRTSFSQSFIVVTQSGSAYTTFTLIPTVLPPGQNQASNSGSSSKTGPIVGGVVGGIVGLAALALLAWFLTKHARQKRLEKEFDGDFSPTRVGKDTTQVQGRATLPDLGLDEEDARITPFPAPGSQTSPGHTSPSMTMSPGHTSPSMSTNPVPADYHAGGYNPSGVDYNSSGYTPLNPDYQSSGYNPYNTDYSSGPNVIHHDFGANPQPGGIQQPFVYPVPMPVPVRPRSSGDRSQSVHSQSTHPSMYPPQQHAVGYPATPSHTSSASSGGAGPGNIPSRKAQEAGIGRMTVANPPEPIVHRDGGRVPQPQPEPESDAEQQELPPTYDSIPREDEPSSSRTRN